MSRFNSKDEVREWADRAAAQDYERHLPVHTDPETGAKWQWDLNPYCTPGARSYWRRGFQGDPRRPWEHDLDWDSQYQRGAAAARIVNQHKPEPGAVPEEVPR